MRKQKGIQLGPFAYCDSRRNGTNMSFFFGKKDKKQNAPAQRGVEVQHMTGSGASIPNANGLKSKDGRAGVISPPPGGSVNNSADHVDSATTPSPEHVQSQRTRVNSDVQVRSMDQISISIRQPNVGMAKYQKTDSGATC